MLTSITATNGTQLPSSQIEIIPSIAFHGVTSENDDTDTDSVLTDLGEEQAQRKDSSTADSPETSQDGHEDDADQTDSSEESKNEEEDDGDFEEDHASDDHDAEDDGNDEDDSSDPEPRKPPRSRKAKVIEDFDPDLYGLRRSVCRPRCN